MDTGNCCLCLPIRTGGTIIGIFALIAFLHNLICAIVLDELLLYFGVNTVIYGTVSIFFIRHKIAKERQFYLRSRLYFKCFLGLVYIIGNIWNFVFWYCMPEYVATACD